MKESRILRRAALLCLNVVENRVRSFNNAAHWKINGTDSNSELLADYKFRDFKETWTFLNKVADAAHALKHHPTITTTYNKVDILLTTHDVGNHITELDLSLASQIEDIYLTHSNKFSK